VSYLPKDDGRNHFQQSQQLQQLVKMEEKRKQLSNIKAIGSQDRSAQKPAQSATSNDPL
jgi:UTP-glucose-1-phosphate uridylyltransferase